MLRSGYRDFQFPYAEVGKVLSSGWQRFSSCFLEEQSRNAPSFARSFWLRYSFAAVSIAVATWVRLLLDPVLGLHQVPFATLFLAIMLTAWYGGFCPALVAALLGSLASLFLLAPRDGFVFRRLDHWVSMILYLGTGFGIAWIGGMMKSVQHKAEVSAQTERHQAMLIDQTHDAVLTSDWKGPITFWNRGAERLYGYSRAKPRDK